MVIPVGERYRQTLYLMRKSGGELKSEALRATLFVPMTGQQKAEHETAKEAVARIVMKWRRYGFLTEADKIRLMAQLQIMRMVCDSTYLLDGETEYGTKADEAATLLVRGRAAEGLARVARILTAGASALPPDTA